MCRVFCQFLMFMPSVVFNLTWAFNPLSTKLPFNACSTTLCLHKVKSEKWTHYKRCACMEGGGEHKGQDFFFNDDVGTVQEEGSAFRMYLAIVCSGKKLKHCWWFIILVEAFSVLNRKKRYQKFMVNTQKGTFEVQGITTRSYVRAQCDTSA